MSIRGIFSRHMAQTSPAPIGLHIISAVGNYLVDADGKKYLDLIGGISVANTGHGHPKVREAIHNQTDQYLHVMVYGELVQTPQAEYAQLLTSHLPAKLDCVYFTNSGAEAVEGAIKLARRVTGKTDIIACNNSYHGSTTGALSLIGDEYWRNAFRPLMPGVWHYDYNSPALLNAINEHTACVVLETVQAEAGIIQPDIHWLNKVHSRCMDTGTLLVFDEIQCGLGRTGKLWGFEHTGVVPDILLAGKALGGGMPLGAFISSYQNMQTLTENPVLGHITTFGGHPVSCAAGKAALQVLLDEELIQTVAEKEKLFVENLQHPSIKAVRSKGLLIAVELESPEKVLDVVQQCISKGVFTDWFLFAPQCLRIAPPLTITHDEIIQACTIIKSCL